MSVGNYTMYQYSRGRVHITGRDVDAPLDFDIGFLTDPHDIGLKQLVWAYKSTRGLMRLTSLHLGEHPGTHPRLAADSPAVLVRLEAPPFTAVEEERIALSNVV